MGACSAHLPSAPLCQKGQPIRHSHGGPRCPAGKASPRKESWSLRGLRCPQAWQQEEPLPIFARAAWRVPQVRPPLWAWRAWQDRLWTGPVGSPPESGAQLGRAGGKVHQLPSPQPPPPQPGSATPGSPGRPRPLRRAGGHSTDRQGPVLQLARQALCPQKESMGRFSQGRDERLAICLWRPPR